ncbi:uncharacterized protein LOC114258917 [Camellia sinensis]|uniref:uncharacterized protein LOC114258917 n=1 Tax=Camellia sinensis TaxID=4442 RepID=UPI0010362466|nr:uncharacterized protein LOC114258917 [Camellia sinensis]
MKQVNHACNKVYIIGWMAALKELAIPDDSPLTDASRLALPFPSTPSQSEDETEEEEGAEVDKAQGVVAEVEDEAQVVGAKSPTLNEQVLDLTQDDNDQVPKAVSEAEVKTAEKSLDQTLFEIDAKNVVEKEAILPIKADIPPTAKVGQSEINATTAST